MTQETQMTYYRPHAMRSVNHTMRKGIKHYSHLKGKTRKISRPPIITGGADGPPNVDRWKNKASFGEKVSVPQYFDANRASIPELVAESGKHIVKNILSLAAVGTAKLAGFEPSQTDSLGNRMPRRTVPDVVHKKIDDALVLYASITNPLLELAKVPLSVSGAIIMQYATMFDLQVKQYAPVIQEAVKTTVDILTEQLEELVKIVQDQHLTSVIKGIIKKIDGFSTDITQAAEPVVIKMMPKLRPILGKAIKDIMDAMIVASVSAASAMPVFGTAFAAITSLDSIVKMGLAGTQAGAATAEAFLDGYSDTILRLKHNVAPPAADATPIKPQMGGGTNQQLSVVPFHKIKSKIKTY